VRRFYSDSAAALPVTVSPSSVSERLADSAITGGGVGALAGLTAWGIFGSPGYDSAVLGIFFSLLGFMGCWGALLGLAYGAASPVSEREIAEPQEPPPAEPPQTRYVLVNAPGRVSERESQQQRFRAFIEACQQSTARASLRGKGFSDPEIAQFGGVLERLGYLLARGTSPQMGYQLTETPDAIIERLRLG